MKSEYILYVYNSMEKTFRNVYFFISILKIVEFFTIKGMFFYFWTIFNVNILLFHKKTHLFYKVRFLL